MDTKCCRACGETKPLDAFHMRRESKDGRMGMCVSCTKAKDAKRYLRSAGLTELTERELPPAIQPIWPAFVHGVCPVARPY